MLIGLVLVGLVLSAAAAGRWGRSGAIGLLVASLLWLMVNQRAEGPVLLSITANHGLAASDLAGLAGLVLGVMILWGSVRGKYRPGSG
jgi:uncharacterized membrane protein